MSDNDDYLMRSLMFVPAHNPKLLSSALRRDADVLLLDIEDSVPPPDKQMARDNIVEFVRHNDLAGKLVFPRVNDRESGELLKDVTQLAIPEINGFMYPKSMKGEDIYFFGKLLETVEYERGLPIGTFKIIPLIETAAAVMNVQEICRACTRVVAVAFGCEDFMTDLQGKHDQDGDSIYVPRAMIAMGARACGVVPIDTVHIRVHDLADLEKNLQVAKNLGFEGMLVLNPAELPLVHQYFSPTKEEYEWSLDMCRLAEEARQEGKGVAVKDGKFIGPPMVKMARNIISKYQSIENKKTV